MNILITGGAGYIGSHMVKYAQSLGHKITIIDNFSTGHHWSISDCEIIDVDILDSNNLKSSLANRSFDGVIHFAAKSLVGESINNPIKYYKNNIAGTLNIIDLMHSNNIKNLIFSSSAAIFGEPISDIIDENHPKKPINPYGISKLYVENILKEFSEYHDLNIICFRYFNAAGADSSAKIGEAHSPETHLIPNILIGLLNNNSKINVNGNDYDTYDGTCIRDYVHVNDLASAHLIGLELCFNSTKKNMFSEYNLGSGRGFSILEIIEACKKITNKKIKYEFSDRRLGDPAILVANNNKAIKHLDWKPRHSSVEEIISTAWEWHKNYFNMKKN